MKALTGVFALLIITIFSGSSQTAQTFPEAVITNGPVIARIYLPDTGKGYYRGSRFDWAGVISSLEYKGHSYFGQWFENYDPYLHDAIMGPVDEFRDPLGYEEAGAGGEFVKVGVGVLRKPDSSKYTFSKKYVLTNPGTWKITTGKDRVAFSQDLNGVNGFSYRYEKVVKLVPGNPLLVLEHRLTNTGSRTLKTSTYNHNFFIIDGEPTGPGLLTDFGFDVNAQGRGFGELANTAGQSVVYTRQLKKGEHVYSENLKVSGNAPEPYQFTVRNKKTGGGVSVTGSRPVDAMVYWACATTACPEPYIHLSLEPGESIDWEISYSFFEKP